MSSPEKILTLHPDNKAGVRIEKAKYDQMSDAILQVLKEKKVLTFKELLGLVRELLDSKFAGSISWYLTSVKLDLEARGYIKRIDNKSPQRITLV